jgi:murein DD-endopeptidase MepM/ murein hydrolase activator NlpD
MSFSEALQSSPSSDVPAALPVVRAKSAPAEAQPSLELMGALTGFSARARHYRAAVATGAAMPEQQVSNWQDLLSTVDAFLRKRPEETSSYDVVRARFTAEAELELDARAYGDFPSEIAEDVVDRTTRLAVRMASLRHLHVRTREPAPTDFDWPVSPVAVTSLFGKRIHPITKRYSPHLGVDLAAESGQLVSAAARGTVLSAEWSGGYGLRVEIQHAGGVITRYGHLSQLLVEPGVVVDKGDPLGLAGNTGLSTGPHLHFELIRNGRPVDPLDEMGFEPAKKRASPSADDAPRERKHPLPTTAS